VEANENVEIVPEPVTSAAAQALIAASNAEQLALYPEEGATHFGLDAAEVTAGRGVFYVAYRSGTPVACVGLRRMSNDAAEIKRMFVVPAARRQGVGARLLRALESSARELGVRRIVLETGDRQPEALALYARRGFATIPRFGAYVHSPLSVCMEKVL
jgi:putative acetyltransferase